MAICMLMTSQKNKKKKEEFIMKKTYELTINEWENGSGWRCVSPYALFEFEEEPTESEQIQAIEKYLIDNNWDEDSLPENGDLMINFRVDGKELNGKVWLSDFLKKFEN